MKKAWKRNGKKNEVISNVSLCQACMYIIKPGKTAIYFH